MKLTIYNALLIFVIGMAVVLVGVFMKWQDVDDSNTHNYVLLGGLSLAFLGTVWFVLSLYRRRKNKD